MTVSSLGRLACAAAICLPRLAHGESHGGTGPLAVALDYVAVPECPDVTDFKATVNGRLGYDGFREGAPDRVLVSVAPGGLAFEGRIEWRNAAGEWAGDRTFPSRSNDCRDLARAMAFALALQIQLLATSKAPADSGAGTEAESGKTAQASSLPPSSPPASPTPASEQGSVPAPKEIAESAHRGTGPALAIGAGALAGWGLASGVVPFGRVSGGVVWPNASVELAAEVGWPTITRRADGAGFSQQHLLLSFAGCGALQPFLACLIGKGGEIRIAGKDVDAPNSPAGAILEAGLRLAATESLGRHVYLTAHVEGLVNLTVWRVTLDQNVVWTSPRFAETVGLDLGLRLH
jgi:hypothetical protein